MAAYTYEDLARVLAGEFSMREAAGWLDSMRDALRTKPPQRHARILARLTGSHTPI